ncbi:MAG: LLM class flavin-dependent oxidoreductase [Alphaproteobacteria bacterium]|nr:LLM class flavin-dependent oxidoreductase [Alphaproteobacteria bacterium]
MRFGYMHLMPYSEIAESGQDWPVANWRFDPVRGAELYDAYIANMAHAERCGFDWVGCNEHHMSPYGLMSNPNIIGAALIQRTKRIEIAIVGSLVPLLNPLRVAEEYAMLDVMSRGRLIAGLLRGIPHEYVAYNIAPDESHERLEEAVTLIKKAWTAAEPFGWEGKYYQFRAVSIWPRPFSKPHPRILMSGSNEQSAEMCARHGAMLGLVALEDLERARHLIKVYRDAAKGFGWEPTPDDILVGLSMSLSEDREEAKERMAKGRKYFGEVLGGGIRTAQKLVVQKTRYFDDSTKGRWKDIAAQMRTTTMDDLIARRTILCGTPEDVVTQIKDIHKAIGHGRMNLNMKIGNIANDVTTSGLELFGQRVLPHVRDL